ncbi:periplasmic copper-binding protein [Desulfuromonas soudanensis]|uniref:Periplasmic copper-binding protein n=1 Tax=Desulfuromonas soudanensis TaxID=1603606 RepID=A0A0M4DAW3_9BACT|nr:NosD domain-containing protein [Desulfuromonas soudanensis]ALC17380.1 periplasmic copper-binding protein [Desulfuromonas soudanensis]
MKNRLSLLLALCCALTLAASPAFAVKSDEILSHHIMEADGTTGQDTNSGSGVKTGHIQDGAVTDAKISGVISGTKLGSHGHTGAELTDGTVSGSKLADGAVTDAKIAGLISSSKIEQLGLDADTVDNLHANDLALAQHVHEQGDVQGLDSALAGKAAVEHIHDGLYQTKIDNVIIVATSGGDFTSLQDAVNSVSSDAVIKVMPGVYAGGVLVYGKNNIAIIGAGADQSILQAEGAAHVLEVSQSNDITITGLGLYVDPVLGSYRTAIRLLSSTGVLVKGNKMVGAGTANTNLFGMDIRPGALIDLRLDILDNAILGFDGGMYLESYIPSEASSTAATIVRGNRIVGHGEFCAGQSGGIRLSGHIPNLRILENDISNNWQGDITLAGGPNYTKRVIVDNNRLFSRNVGLNISGTPVAITNNVIYSGGLGIMIYGSYSADPAGNSLGSVISGNLVINSSRGLYVSDYPVTVVHNVFEGSSDIYIANPQAKTLLSHNVYRAILLATGTTVVGKFNSDFEGNLIAPQ